MNLKFFPWENGIKPYWVNPDNGLEWYVDAELTKYCTRETVNDLPKLNAVVFYVAKRDGDKVDALSRVLVDIETNSELGCATNLEAMCAKIDILRLANSYSE